MFFNNFNKYANEANEANEAIASKLQNKNFIFYANEAIASRRT